MLIKGDVRDRTMELSNVKNSYENLHIASLWSITNCIFKAKMRWLRRVGSQVGF